jgi:glycopeptide antibiotics resistance protein
MKKAGIVIASAYVGLIIILHIIPTGSIVPKGSSFNIEFNPDYIFHVLLFLPWMSAARLIDEKQLFLKGKPFTMSWMILGLFVAAGAEWAQYFIVYRVFNPIDLILSMAGVIAGWLPAKIF